MAQDVQQDLAMPIEFRFQGEALLALQEAAEAYLVHLFEDAYVPRPIVCYLTPKHVEMLALSMEKGLPLCQEIFSWLGAYVECNQKGSFTHGCGANSQKPIFKL